MNTRTLNWLWLALAALAPIGTRYISTYGTVAGVPVEWGTVSLYGSQLLLLGLVTAALWFTFRDRTTTRPPQPSRVARAIMLAFLVLALAVAISTLNSPFGLQSGAWLVLIWIILGCSLFTSTVAARRPNPVWPLVGLVLGGVFQAGLAISQFLTQSIFANKWFGLAAQKAADLGTFVVETGQGRWLRAYGTLGHPNLLGFYLVLALVAAVSLLLVTRSPRWRRRLLWAALPLLGAGLMTTYSRSVMLAAFAAAIVLPITLAATKQKDLARTAFTGFTVAFVAALFLAALTPQLIQTRSAGTARLEVRSNQARLSQTHEAIQLAGRAPWFGVGPTKMPQALATWYPDRRSPYAYQPVHNVPLLLLAEVGPVGLAAWLAIFLAAVWALLGSLRHRRHHLRTQEAWLTAGGLALLAATLTVSVLDHYLWSLWPGQLLGWIVLSLAVISYRPAGR